MSDFLNKYEMLGRIAKGGMAEIYKVKLHGARGFEKIYAIKVIHPHLIDNPEMVSMFISEATLAAKLDHPNIVKVLEFYEEENEFFIIMEFVNGMDLKTMRSLRSDFWKPEHVFFIATKVLAGLGHAHKLKNEKGFLMDLIHRDVSPHNIMLSSNGEIKLADFGIAKIKDAVSYTNTNMVRGKLHYLSPEQARGNTNLDPRSDIFSLGLVLWELLTGQKRYKNRGNEVYNEIMAGSFIAPSTINPTLDKNVDQLLYRFLATDKNHRFENCEEAIEEIINYYSIDQSAYFTKLVKDLIREREFDYDTEIIGNMATIAENRVSYVSEQKTRELQDNKETKVISPLKNELLKAEDEKIEYMEPTKTMMVEVKDEKKSKKIYFAAGIVIIVILGVLFIVKKSLDEVNKSKKTSIIDKKPEKVVIKPEKTKKPEEKEKPEIKIAEPPKTILTGGDFNKKIIKKSKLKRRQNKIIILKKRPEKIKEIIIKKTTKNDKTSIKKENPVIKKPEENKSGLKKISGWD
jgi:serine/threonine protein kinase